MNAALLPRFYALLLFLFFCLPPLPALAAPAASTSASEEGAGMPTELPGYSMNDLRKLADLVQRTGVGSDKIPSLDRPQYLSISDASLSMDDNEAVFVVHHPGDLVRIYPQRIMVWHEIINDTLPLTEAKVAAYPSQAAMEKTGEGYTLSYSPLTGSVVGFRSMASRYPTSFGVSGTLLNGNSVFYDRISRSLWSQLLAVCIEGPFRGKRLQRFPVLWARWGGVKEFYGGLNSNFTGKAEVLSRSTGHRRSYGKDPYGNYQIDGTYYHNNKIPFPVSFLDPRLPPKTRILGLELDTAYGAVQKDAVKQVRVLNFTLGVTPLVAIHDQELDAIRIFDRRLPGREDALTFIAVRLSGKV